MGIPNEFYIKHGLQPPKIPKKRRLILVGCGEKATGKTDFCLRTMPKPLLHIDLDKNTEGLEDRYIGQEIAFKHVDIPILLNEDKDFKILMGIKDVIVDSMDKGYFRSYCIDTGDKLYELARRGYLGSLDFGDVPQAKYAGVNSFMFKIFNKAKECRVNLAMQHHMKDERKDGLSAQGKKTSVPTGKRIMSGWRRVMEPAQIVCRFFKDPKESGVERYGMEIMECNANSELEGQVLIGDEIDFLRLGKMVFAPHAQSDAEWL